MTILCLCLAVAAVLLGVPAPPGRELGARLAPAHPPTRTGRSRRLLTAVTVLAAVGAIVVTSGLLAGPRAVVATLAVLLALATVGRLAVQGWRLRQALRSQAEVAQACGLLASHVRVGQVAGRALALAAAECAVLEESSRCQVVGGDPLAVWRDQSRRPGHGGLLELARAWQVSTETGAPLSGALELVAASQSADQTLRAVVAGELAAPRATSKVMAVLPACGIGMGYLLGGDPLTWLMAGPLGWACLLLGVTLACAGVLWIELLARRAAGEG